MGEDLGRRLHFAATVVDGHSDVFCDVADRRMRGETGVLSRLHVPAWRAGGVNVVLTTLYVEEEHKPDRALRRAMTLLGALNDIAETPDIALCRNRAEIDAALARGQIAFVLGIEGGECIQDGVASLRVFYELGVRVLGLTWNQRNLDDDQLRAVAARGGTIGVNMVAPFIADDPTEANIERLLDHIDYIAALVGAEHVAIGPDFVDYLDFGHTTRSTRRTSRRSRRCPRRRTASCAVATMNRRSGAFSARISCAY